MEHDPNCEIKGIVAFLRGRGASIMPEELHKLQKHESGDFCLCPEREKQGVMVAGSAQTWAELRNRAFKYLLQERSNRTPDAVGRVGKMAHKIVEQVDGKGARIIEVDFRNRRRLN